MAPLELTVAQCRFLARLRANLPQASVILHGARRGVIIEVRHGHRVELARLEPSGRVRRDRLVRAR